MQTSLEIIVQYIGPLITEHITHCDPSSSLPTVSPSLPYLLGMHGLGPTKQPASSIEYKLDQDEDDICNVPTNMELPIQLFKVQNKIFQLKFDITEDAWVQMLEQEKIE